MAIFLVWLLKVFGVLWVIGGLFVIRQCWVERGIDAAISDIETMAQELGEDVDADQENLVRSDPGRTMWLLVGGVLTVLSGVALVFPGRYILVPLSMLVVHQGLYAWRQSVKVRQATNADAAEDAAMSPAARNGAIVSVGVFLLSASLVWTGHL